jgi:hypothetical protein
MPVLILMLIFFIIGLIELKKANQIGGENNNGNNEED